MNPSLRPPSITPLTPMRPSYRWLAVLLAGLAGLVEILAVYYAVASQLPAEVPTHYNAQGVADAFGPPGAFVLAGVVGQIVVTGTIAALFAALGSDVPLERRHARSALDPAAAFSAVILAGVFPLAWWGELLELAGAWPLGSVHGWQVGLLLALGSAAAAGYFAIRFARSAPAPEPIPFGDLVRVRSARRGPIFECTACGRRHLRSAWWMLAPRVGVSAVAGGASYYLRCPVCGERGWFPRVGWVHDGELAADRPATRA